MSILKVDAISNLFETVSVNTVDLVGKTLPAVLAPTLSNGWANVGGTRVAAGYYKDAFGIVRLQGSISNPGSPATPGVICILPAGYRPLGRVSFAVHSGSTGVAGVIGFVFIDSDGYVYYDGGNLTEFSLDGIYFRTT
jgi:hypothetical protein